MDVFGLVLFLGPGNKLTVQLFTELVLSTKLTDIYGITSAII